MEGHFILNLAGGMQRRFSSLETAKRYWAEEGNGYLDATIDAYPPETSPAEAKGMTTYRFDRELEDWVKTS